MKDEKNVISMEEKKRVKAEKAAERKAEKEAEGEGPKIADLYFTLAQCINFHDFSIGLPPFPERYYVCAPSGGVKKIIKVHGDREVQLVDIDDLMSEIVRYSQNIAPSEAYKWTISQIKEAARYWFYYTDPVKTPRAVGFKETTGLVFHRLPWVKDPAPSPTPYFDELFSRITNGDALKKWIGSLFYEDSDRQQYCWVTGPGRNGKGALSRFLRRVFGQSYSSENVPERSERFWTSGLVGKRLVVFNDCNHYGFPSSGLFKSLTGGDAIRVEEKFGKTSTAIINAKFLFMSNEQPALSSGEADTRRVIFCEIGEIKNAPDSLYETRLWSEGNQFILDCIKSYNETNGNHSLIDSDSGAIDDWIGVCEERFETLLHSTFHVKQGGMSRPKDVQEFYRAYKLSRADQLGFVKYITRKYGIKRALVRQGKEVGRYYIGMEIKTHFQRNNQ